MAVVAIVAGSPVPEPSPEAKADPQVIWAGPGAFPWNAPISWNGLAISPITGLPVLISQALQLAPGTVVWPNGLVSSSSQIIQIA